MDGVDSAVWAEVERAARLGGVEPEAFALAALAKAAEAALAEVTIYALDDPRTGQTRYVGQTNDLPRRMKAHRRDLDGSARAAWVTELKGEGLEPVPRVLSVVPAAEADYTEQWFIDGLRGDGCRLLNVRQAYDLPVLELRLIPPTLEWLQIWAERKGWTTQHLIENAIVAYEREEEQADATG